MAARVAINGFGRVGRLCLRSMLEHHKDELSVVALNDLADLKTNAHLLQYDSSYGPFTQKVEIGEGLLKMDGWEIRVFNQKDPSKLPWKALDIDIVIESTGVFTDGAHVRSHLDAGAKNVIITAPAKNIDFTVVLGVNESQYDPKKQRMVSNASCTTNCLAPVVKVLHDTFGIERGFMTTVHAYTNDQRILDLMHKDLRRARAAAMNIIPTSTGAAKALKLVIPEMAGKLDGFSIRVPTPTVSVVDLTFTAEKPVSVESINAAIKAAAEGPMKGILGYTEEELVSTDFRGNPLSSIFDSKLTKVIGSTGKIISWYDNEWGYSNRVTDLILFLVKKGL